MERQCEDETCREWCRVPDEIRPKAKYCLKCFARRNRERVRAYHEANRELERQRARERYRQKAPELRQKSREWYAKNSEAHKHNVKVWQSQNKDKAKQHRKTYREKVRSDPERWERLLENERIRSKLRREREGIELRPPSLEAYRQKNAVKKDPLLPVASLLPYIEDWLRSNQLATLPPSLQRRILCLRNGQEYASLAVLDRVCLAIGIPLAWIDEERDAA